MAPKLSPEDLERARRALRRKDPVLGAVVRRVGPCDLRPRGDPYASLHRASLHQQLAGAAAATIERRVKALFGGRVPRPAAFLATDDVPLRSAGLSRQKLAALRDLARAFDAGELDARRLGRLDDAGVVEAVTRVRGIGEWTAHMLLMTSLGRPDVLPVGDYGVRKAVQNLYGLGALPGRGELEAIAEPWRPWRSVASWYLWRSLDLKEATG
jgi:DNA-3-methyladenine glycosylase II